MSVSSWKRVLLFVPFLLVACGDDDVSDGCTTDRECDLGQLCLDGTCRIGARDAGSDVQLDLGVSDVGEGADGTIDAGDDALVAECTESADCNDDNDCTEDICASGACVNQPLSDGEACSGGVCHEATLVCVSCVNNMQCDEAAPTCDTTTHTCASCATNDDCDDGNDCTDDVCEAGSCSNPTKETGADCTGDDGTGGVCDADTMCVVCIGDDDCEGSMRCDTGAHECVACLSDAHCLGSERCDLSMHTCANCLSAADCNDSVECTADTCTAGECANTALVDGVGCTGGVCRQDSRECVECVGNDQCSGGTPTCNTTTNTCVSCLRDTDCDDGNDCTDNSCGSGRCRTASGDPGRPCAGGVCSNRPSMCVECIRDEDCISGGERRCDTELSQCVQCLGDADCLAGGTCSSEGACLACEGPTCPGIPEHLSATTFDGSVGNEQGRAIATDDDGNIFIAGPYNGTFTLNLPGGGLGSYTSRGESDIFVFKFNRAGVLQWAKSFGSTLQDSCRGIATDASGNVFVTGQYQGTGVHVDAGPELPYVDGDGKNFFVASLTSGGAHRWSRGFTGAGTDSGDGIVVRGEHVYAVGFFSNIIAIGATDESSGPNVETTIDAFRDILVFNLDRADGSLRWHRAYGGPGNDTGWAAAAIDTQHKLYLTGSFTGTVNFGAQGPATAVGTQDMFILKINQRGEERRLNTFGGVSASTVGRTIEISTDRGVVVGGKFTGGVRFIGALETSQPTGDGILLSLDSNLQPQWYRTLGARTDVRGGGRTQILGLDVAAGQVFVTGLFDNGTRIGSTFLTSNGGDDAFVASYSLDGTFHWAVGFGSTAADQGWDVASHDGRTYVTGFVTGDTNFGSGVVPISSSPRDMFLTTYRTR